MIAARAVVLGSIASVALCAALPASAQQRERGLANPDSEFVDTTSKRAWHAVVEKTERGYLIGNPDAEAKLIIFTSYACEGCHDFAFKGDPELDIALLAPGLMSVEIRQRLHHPADMPLALLASCGEPKKFKINHAMFMRDQKRWRESWQSASAYNRGMWSRGTAAAHTSLVSSLDFDDMMARRRGYSRMDLTRCLTDRKAILSLRRGHAADSAEFGLPEEPLDKPYFALDGVLLEGIRDWDALYPLLEERFKPGRE